MVRKRQMKQSFQIILAMNFIALIAPPFLALTPYRFESHRTGYLSTSREQPRLVAAIPTCACKNIRQHDFDFRFSTRAEFSISLLSRSRADMKRLESSFAVNSRVLRVKRRSSHVKISLKLRRTFNRRRRQHGAMFARGDQIGQRYGRAR